MLVSRTPNADAMGVRWIHGSPSAKHNTDPDIQVHAYDEHTVILRQNMAVNYEAPFMFLLFGARRAVLIDTGATASPEHFPIRRVVDDVMAQWQREHGMEDDYGLLVLHTHPHGDHVAGDGQFVGRPGTEVVGADLDSAWRHFGFVDDAQRVAPIDLGGRVLECFATPGHHEAAVTYYDPSTGILLTGDTVYPGRLYVNDWAAFRESIDRMIAFTEERNVTHVLGCHIEMTSRPGVDYPVLTTYQPDEPPLELTVSDLRDLRDGLVEIGERPERRAFDRFIIEPEDA
jgi:hydroxyacylglutathione hydrolase